MKFQSSSRRRRPAPSRLQCLHRRHPDPHAPRAAPSPAIRRRHANAPDHRPAAASPGSADGPFPMGKAGAAESTDGGAQLASYRALLAPRVPSLRRRPPRLKMTIWISSAKAGCSRRTERKTNFRSKRSAQPPDTMTMISPRFRTISVNALSTQRPRRGLMVVASVLAVVVIGAWRIHNVRPGGAVTVESPPVIAANGAPTKIIPDEVVAADNDPQNKLIYDRVDAAEGAADPADAALVTPGDAPAAPAAGADDADNPIARVIMPGGPGARIYRRRTGRWRVSPRWRMRRASGSGGRHGDERHGRSEAEIGPRKVRTVIVKPDGTIVSSNAVDATPTADTAGDVSTRDGGGDAFAGEHALGTTRERRHGRDCRNQRRRTADNAGPGFWVTRRRRAPSRCHCRSAGARSTPGAQGVATTRPRLRRNVTPPQDDAAVARPGRRHAGAGLVAALGRRRARDLPRPAGALPEHPRPVRSRTSSAPTSRTAARSSACASGRSRRAMRSGSATI